MERRPLQFWHPLSGVGLILGTLFFVAALTPTLVPRTYLTQGALSGVCFAAGYGLGAFLHWVWAYMQLPQLSLHTRRDIRRVAAIVCVLLALLFLWRAATWQNPVRAVMGLEPVASSHPFKVCAIAALTFLFLLALARGFRFVFNLAAEWIHRWVPRRISNVIGVVVAVLLFWTVANGVFFRIALSTLDASFREYNALIEPERPQPTSPLRTGSAASLIAWKKLGRAGREFIASGPTAQDISTFTGRKALEPIRVYVGLGVAGTPQDRAKLALEELKRTGAFNRSVLIVITPTGTGWIDPAAMNSVEYLLHGDVASVAQQYSYLNSPLSLMVQPEYGAEAARALFTEIYGYWTRLPKDSRPKIYLHGLSLGAMNSAKSAELFETIGDPLNGAVWSGPPFASQAWRSFTDRRNTGSPEWLPEFGDGSFLRFMNQDGGTARPQAPWGPMRVVYLQYASDAITFFDYRDLYRQPDWMASPRGPDVVPELRWYPVVTMLQLGLDMAVAMSTPMGYGHVYAPEHYVNAWNEVLSPEGWTAEDIARLKHHLATEARAALLEAYADRGG
jgi:uncharacterized membrane protein